MPREYTSVTRRRSVRERTHFLPCHHLLHWNFLAKDETRTMCREVLAGKFSLHKLLDFRRKIFWENRSTSGNRLLSASSSNTGYSFTYPVLCRCMYSSSKSFFPSTKIGLPSARALTGLRFNVASKHHQKRGKELN